MTKYFWTVCLLICLGNTAHPQNKKLQPRRIKNPTIVYIPSAKIKRYPFPVVNFVREGLAKENDINEIMGGIVYPLINKSKKPIAAIIVEFYPNESDITVLVLYHGEEFKGILIKRNAAGHFDADAYKVFFEEIEI